MEFIDKGYISSLIEENRLNDTLRRKDMISKIPAVKGNTLEENVALLNNIDTEISEVFLSTVSKIKEIKYCNLPAFFAPMGNTMCSFIR
jgi:hypothetical protein